MIASVVIVARNNVFLKAPRFGTPGKSLNLMPKSSFPLRIGLGHDTHRLMEGTEITLGGVRIPFDYSLVGHSDADVLLHAVTDALLGAAAIGDIGDLFPDSDPNNRGRSSVEMLQIAYKRVRKEGYVLVNLDCILFAEKPKLGPFKKTIRDRLAEILEVEPDQISLKAKTGEKVGPIGRLEAISAEAISLLEKG